MKICYGVKTQITHFRCLRISPLIFATVQNFALDNLRDQQILIPTCEWGWVVMVPLLNTTLEVEESPGMVCPLVSGSNTYLTHNSFDYHGYDYLPTLIPIMTWTGCRSVFEILKIIIYINSRTRAINQNDGAALDFGIV